MRPKKEDELYDEYDHASISFAWWSMPKFIDWLKNQRKFNPNETFGINLTIILQSATLIEGYLYELLSGECEGPLYNKSMEDRLLIDLNNRLSKASWLNYQELFLLIIGKKLSDFIDKESWKAINILFQLRNLLTHGKSVELKFYSRSQKEPEIKGKYKTIYEYYKEVKIIDVKSDDFAPGAVGFVTSESADFFFRKSRNLMDILYEKIGKSEKYNGLIAESYEWVFNN